MKEWVSYFGEIIVVIAVSGMLYAAAPDGKTKRYVQFVLSLCVLSATVFPLISLAETLPQKISEIRYDISKEEAASEDEITDILVEASRAEIAEAITQMLCAKFDYDEKEIRVTLTLDARDTEAIRITAIRVDVDHVTTQTKARMKEYLEDVFLGETTVTVFGEE